MCTLPRQNFKVVLSVFLIVWCCKLPSDILLAFITVFRRLANVNNDFNDGIEDVVV